MCCIVFAKKITIKMTINFMSDNLFQGIIYSNPWRKVSIITGVSLHPLLDIINKLQMIKYTFFTIPNGIPYQELKKPLTFQNDSLGISNWVLRLPLTIYSTDCLQKHLFTEDSVVISSHSGIIDEERWKYFVTTKNDGSHLYCTTQIFYEKSTLTNCFKLKKSKGDTQKRQDEYFYIPKCLVLMSHEPFFKMHVNLLRIYRQILKASPSISHPINPRIISSYLNLKSQGRKDEFILVQNRQEGKRAEANMILDYYIQKMNQHKGRQTLLIQKFTNLPILHLYPLRSNQTFQFKYFFNLPLSSQTISCTINAILLEKQIIFASKSTNLGVMVIQSLLEIIRPLQWQHMLVHHLPCHLLQAANQNFMPFIVGVNQRHLSGMNTQNRFIVLIDEDRVIKPESIVGVGPALDQFSRLAAKKTSPSLSNQRNILLHSIEFMCQLLKPIYRSLSLQYNIPFYSQFLQTSLYQHFAQMVQNNELSDFVGLLGIEQPQERIIKIERELNDLTYYLQNPKLVYNEIQWIQYYLSRTNSNLTLNKREKENKLLSLKDIKDSIITQANRPLTSRKGSAITRIRSQSTIQPRPNKSVQKIKVSMVRHDNCFGPLNQLLQQKLGVDIKLV